MGSETVLLTVILACLLPWFGASYPFGPPVEARESLCRDMDPVGHGPRTVTGPAPYAIKISRYTYGPEQPVYVTLRANTGESFHGFFLQARRQSGGDINQAMGEFTSISIGTKFLTCSTPASAWGHNSNVPKTAVTATWTPPTTDQGPITFKATIVKGPASKFWTNVRSETMYFSPYSRDDEREGGTTSEAPSYRTYQICLSTSNASRTFRPSVTITTVLLMMTSLLLGVFDFIIMSCDGQVPTSV